MKERPILFSAPMVEAIRAGRKMMTRRAVKLAEFQRSDTPGYDFTFRDRAKRWHDYRSDDITRLCPYGRPWRASVAHDERRRSRSPGRP
jgi:hypothetical protein